MRILLCSHTFAPNVGGIETVASILAAQFTLMGSKVTVVTSILGDADSSIYPIVRRPSLGELRRLGRDADIIFQNNISLRTLVPLLSLRKPVVIAHQTWLTRTNGWRSWQDYLKRSIIPICQNISISEAVAATLPVKSQVIGNPFEALEFAGLSETPRTKDIVFLGRLVSDKGCDLVLSSLSLLKEEGIYPSLSIIGDGPELLPLKRQAADLGLSDQVSFLGSIGEGRGREVAQHRIMVIPSRWAEPFGVVALEGLAAGCALVASSQGGLPEAVGPCGILFPNGDSAALASALKELLSKPAMREELVQGSVDHLKRFAPEVIATRYLDVFQSVCAAG